MAITNGTFNTNLNGWTNTVPSGGYYTGSYVTNWENGKAHIKSGSTYDGSFEIFVTFWQRFQVDKSTLIFDVQALISGSLSSSGCGSGPSSCGWVVTDDSNNVISYGQPGTTLTTIAVDLKNYLNQYVTLTFRVGAARNYGYYYDLLVDNVATAYGTTFRAICPDSQYCDTSLYIDYNYAGITQFTTYLNLGTHNYSLFKNGYNRFDGSINITSTEINTQQTTGLNIDSTLAVGPGGIINGTFGTDLTGWIVSGAASWDNGRVHLNYGGSIYQIFAVADNELQFDYESIGYAPSDSGLGYRLYVDDVLILDKRLPGNYGNAVYGTEKVYLGNYIGKTAKILFYEAYGWEGWIDNVSPTSTTGIYNGTFDKGQAGWDISGEVSFRNCTDWPARWGPPCSGTYAQIGINDGGQISQTFVLDKCHLKFDWLSGWIQGYNVYLGDTIIASGSLLSDSEGTEIVDLSNYVGSTLKVVFYSNQFLAIDNVTTITNPYDVSVISYPPGAYIYLDDIPTGQITGNIPVIINGGSEGTHTVTVKLSGYTDYIETINIVRCQTTYITAVFTGCVTFFTNPTGAKICIDNIDTNQITPNNFCGYDVGSSHTYSLYFKNYRVETGTITFSSDKGIIINKILTYETGSTNFNIVPNGANIIIDGTDTGKLTPATVDDLPIGYHNFEIRLDGYYSLTGSFRSIVDTIKQITGALQPITGVINGKFDTDLNGWTLIIPNSNGNIIWDSGRAHLYGHDVSGLTIYQDITVVEDSLLFDFNVGDIRYSCDSGWNIIIDPDTPNSMTVASWCSSSGGWQGGRFEADVTSYKGRNARISLYLNCRRRWSWGSDAWVDNVSNVPKPTRSITLNTFCSTLVECPARSLSMTKCFAYIYFDNNFIGIDDITLDNLSIGSHSYKVRNQGYLNIDTGNQDVTGNITFSQGISSKIYIDNIYLPTGIVPLEGCIRFESIPPGLHIYIDGQDTGKVTPDTVCNLTHSLSLSRSSLYTLTSHSYELKLLHSSYQGNFDLGPTYGEYIYVELYGKIQIDTIPEGASVILDGVDTGGTTPYNTGNIPIGIHTYKLRLNNFQEQTCQIEVIKDQTVNVNLELISSEGCIYVDSCPTCNIAMDGISQGTTPLSICDLIGQHEYTLSKIGYFSYSETFTMPIGTGINRRIYLNRKIGVPILDPTKEICSSNSTKITFSSPAPYYPDTSYEGKDAFQMQDSGVELIDAQGYDVIHLHALYHNFWIGYTQGPIGGRIDIYQSDDPGSCTTRPAGAEQILSEVAESWNGTIYNSYVLFDDSLNISKRYIRIETYVYACSLFNCWGDGSSSIFVMEKLPTDCPLVPTTTCEKIVTCIIKRDEGVYSKDRYCYLGEGIFTKKAIGPPIILVGTNTISQNCGDWPGVHVDCWIGNDGDLILENMNFSPGWIDSNFEAKGTYVDFYTPGGLWQLYDVTTSTWIVGTGDGYNTGAYVSVSGNIHYEIPAANKGHTLQIWFYFPSLHYHYDHIKNIFYQ